MLQCRLERGFNPVLSFRETGDLVLQKEQRAVVVAEWLRRWTRNPLGSPRAGSSPADYGSLFELKVGGWTENSMIIRQLQMLGDVE